MRKFLTKLIFVFTFIIGMFVSVYGYAQQTLTINGEVVDAQGQPVMGASVLQERTSNGTMTGIDGKFLLKVPSEAKVKVSFVGYVTQEITVQNQTYLKIVLQENSKVLNDVVVIGYGIAKKSDLTGSVGSVGSKDLAGAPVQNLGQALQGKISGVLIDDNGAPGSDVTIKIRGLGTINNSNPLVVIDGVPTDLSLSALNMNDVDRVDVLKDASATAIYGSRGANGVVMITTKSGKLGDAVLSVSANWNVQQSTHIPKLLNASEYAAYNNDMLKNAGLTTNPDWSDPSKLGKGTDWMDEMLQTGTVQNYTVSYSGGDEKRHYYFSAGVLDQKGLVIHTNYRRFSFRNNSDYKLKPWLKVSNNIIFSVDNKDNGNYSISDAMFALPTQSVKDADGTWSGPSGNSLWYGDICNPVGTATLDKNNTKGYNLLANISAEISLSKSLTFKSTFGYDAKFWFYNNFTPAYAWKPIPVSESSRFEESDKSFTYLWDNYFTYNHNFGRHHVDVMAGTSAQNNKYDYLNADKSDFLYDNVSQLTNGSKIKSADGDMSEWSIFSLMARANYSYADKYLFTTTLRRDGSSRFGSGKKYGWFPSFSGAWRISQESWFPKVTYLNDVKLRAGYGVTGNQEIGNYTFSSTYGTGVYVFNGTEVKALSSITMANPKVHWEEVRQTNVGVDLSMLNNRVNLSVDAYVKNTCDMLVKAALPITSGYEDVTTTYVNAGKVQNKGIEISLSTINLKGVLKWESAFNVSYNKNRIRNLNSDTPLYLNQYNNSYLTIQKIGSPINAFYGYVTDGIFQNQQEVNNHAVQVSGGTAPGDVRFKDLDNNGVIDQNDRTIIGNPNPTWIFATTQTLRYKSFDLSVFLQGVAGNDIYNVNNITSEGMSAAHNQTHRVVNRWTAEGTSSSMPRAIYGDPNQNCRASDRFIENGSYLRIKNITLGYTLPQNFLRKICIEQARINISCENLATITGYRGFDPEVDINGIDSSRYPLARTFSVGLNLNF